MKMVKSVYVSGPLTGVKDLSSLKAFYEKIGEVCTLIGASPYIPHQLTDPIIHSYLSPEDVYTRDREQVINANLVIAYVGIPSLGVGQEVEIARENSVPIILIFESDKTVSKMVLGNPGVKLVVTEVTREIILAKLMKFLPQLLDLHTLMPA